MKTKFIFIASLIMCIFIKTSNAQLTASITPAGDTLYICPGATLQLNGNPSGGIPPYNHLWTSPGQLSSINTQTTIFTADTSATTVIYTVTDSAGSTAADTILLIIYPKPIVDAGSNPTICPGQCINITATANMITYSWMPGAMQTQSVTVCPLTNTTYTLIVTDVNGCTASDVVTVNLSLPMITDAGEDQTICLGLSTILDPGLNGGVTYIWTPSIFLSNPAIYNPTAAPTTTITYTLFATNGNGCSASDAVTIYVTDCQDTITGKVFMDSNNDHIQNGGEQGANQFMVKIMPINNFTFTDTNGNYIIPVPIGTHTISLPNIPVFSTCTPATNTTNFILTGEVDSLNDFAIYQIPDVKELAVTLHPSTIPRPGFYSYFYINYKNNGSIAMNGTIEFIFDNHYSYLACSPVYSGFANDTIVWNVNNLLPMTSGLIIIEFLLPSNTTIGTQLLSTATFYPVTGDTIPSNNIDTVSETVVGSYDPNDKSVEPSEPLTMDQILNEKPLTYTIRFQNTGTAEAINVVVKDTLNDKLNIGSFEMLAASHPYSMQIKDGGILEWTFNNIDLPDSTSDEPNSHGFISYKIKIPPSLIESDTIFNTAYIYFDYNAAVATNTVSTYLASDPIVVAPEQGRKMVELFPNPAKEELVLKYNLNDESHFELYNSLGVKAMDVILRSNSASKTINLTGIDNGLYFYSVSDNKGNNIKVGKLVVLK